jgi:hypothetical protein
MLIYILAWLQAILDERNRPFEVSLPLRDDVAARIDTPTQRRHALALLALLVQQRYKCCASNCANDASSAHRHASAAQARARFTCFTGTNAEPETARITQAARIDTHAQRRHAARRAAQRAESALYLLYWYKSTNTDVASAQARRQTRCTESRERAFLALLVQQYKY